MNRFRGFGFGRLAGGSERRGAFEGGVGTRGALPDLHHENSWAFRTSFSAGSYRASSLQCALFAGDDFARGFVEEELGPDVVVPPFHRAAKRNIPQRRREPIDRGRRKRRCRRTRAWPLVLRRRAFSIWDGERCF